MCGVCGCNVRDEHVHEHHENHKHPEQMLMVEQDILSHNNALAANNRKTFHERQILALNFMSSPGAGKTTLLTQCLLSCQPRPSFFVIVADQQTARDAERIAHAGIPALQINTGKSCHLDAHAVYHAMENLALPKQSILCIENIGNLVCPALFDLGQAYNIVILSVTEGDDKPLKYPHMFYTADVVLITKTDLLPYVDFSVDKAREYIQHINPKAQVIAISAQSGENLKLWQTWLQTAWEKEFKSALTGECRV